MQNYFHQILSEGGQHEPQTTGLVTFASLWSHVISELCAKDFFLGWREMALVGEEGVVAGAIASKYVV